MQHRVELVIFTEDTEDTRFCLDKCPMRNLYGYPHDCDFLECVLETNEKGKFRAVRDPRCPWKCEKMD